MKKALIDPSSDNRVCQVVPPGEEFPVAEPLEWRDCPDDCVADVWTFDGARFIPPAPVEPAAAPASGRPTRNVTEL